MRKSRLFFLTLFVISALCSVLMNESRAVSASTLSKHARETAIEVGPENMVRFGFRDGYLRANYEDIDEVNATQQHIADLYPNRPDLYMRAVNELGKCLKEEGCYTQQHVNKVVKYMTHFSDDCYNRKYSN